MKLVHLFQISWITIEVFVSLLLIFVKSPDKGISLSIVFETEQAESIDCIISSTQKWKDCFQAIR